MKKMLFLAIMMTIAISAAASESWPTNKENFPKYPLGIGKYPSWPFASVSEGTETVIVAKDTVKSVPSPIKHREGWIHPAGR